MSQKTRRYGQIVIAVAGAVLFSMGSLGAFAQQSIKLGVTLPLSGAQEALGQQQLAGAEIAVAMINDKGGIDGRKLELIVRDDAADPNKGVANVTELAGAGANLILGGLQTSIVMGVKPLLPQLNAVFISTAATTDALTQKEIVPNYFRITDNFGVRSHAQALFMVKKFPNAKRWTGLVADAAFGRSAWDAFKVETAKAYAAAGKTVEFADPVLFTFGATDFRNQAAKLLSSPADGIYVIANGADAITFYNQATSLGLLTRYQVVIDAGNETLLANAMGSRTPPGIWTISHWYPGSYQDTELGKYLLEKAAVKFGGVEKVSGYVEPTFAAVIAYASAIKKAGGSDTAAVITALEGMTLETPKGPVTLRKDDHQAITDVNFFQIDVQSAAPGWKVKDAVKIPGAEAALPVVK